MEEYVKVAYSRSQIEKAGKEIAKGSGITAENEHYLNVIDNWRAAHAYPLYVISDLIEQALANQIGLLRVHRLKRLDSIVGKLQRPNNTGLYRMQDLGGCRVIVPNVDDVYQVAALIERRVIEAGHIIKSKYDYLKNPPEHSGYRSYHLVVQYQGEDDYNGMFIEIQVRTKLQHTWATAVEVIDCIERNRLITSHEREKNGLKAGAGKDSYRLFFKLVSALFSINEGTSVVTGVPQDKQEIIESIYHIDNTEKIRDKLASYSHAINLSGTRPDDADYYLLITDIRRKTIQVLPFEQTMIGKATELYEKLEKQENRSSLDVVLVAAKTFGILKESYSNYFGDAQLFLSSVDEFCSDIPEKPKVVLDMRSNCKKIKELFDIKRIKGNIPAYIVNEDGIGISKSKIYICHNDRMTLQDSYLRLSGIKLQEDKIREFFPEMSFTHVKGPGILASRRGATYYIEDEEWDLVCDDDCLIIQPKEGNSPDSLILLISWLKSNVFMWDILWNKNAHSLLKKNILDYVLVPEIGQDDFMSILETTRTLLELEYKFVAKRDEQLSNGSDDINEEEIYQFNRSVIDSLRKNEDIYISFFGISEEEQKNMEHELNLKGYFVYK